MHITTVNGRPSVTLIGVEEIGFVLNWMKPFRNTERVGAWLNILEPLCAPVIEGTMLPPRDSVTILFKGHRIDRNKNECLGCGTSFSLPMIPEDTSFCPAAEDVDEESETVPSEAYRVVAEEDEADSHLVQVDGGSENTLCLNCTLPYWRHTDLTHRCIKNGVLLSTVFQASDKLLPPAEVTLTEDFREMVENIQHAEEDDGSVLPVILEG